MNETSARSVDRKQRRCRSPIEPAPMTRTWCRRGVTLAASEVALSSLLGLGAEADAGHFNGSLAHLFQASLHENDVAAVEAQAAAHVDVLFGDFRAAAGRGPMLALILGGLGDLL